MPLRPRNPHRSISHAFIAAVFVFLGLLFPLLAQPAAQPSIADILEQAGDLSNPDNRRRAVERVRAVEEQRRAAAEQIARARGLPIRIERPDGTVQELVDFKNERPIYLITHNTAAAISTGASVLRLSPYNLTGSGLAIGVWDGGAVRITHQEFATGARAVVKDGSASIDHATHVAGTIAAAGVVTSARGMATAILIDSYDWNTDKTEMTARAATAPGQVDQLYLSNHSYGYASGWTYVNGGSPFRVWEWSGDGTTAASIDFDFGRYNVFARDSDSLAFNAPYFLMFRSAGNDRADNPATGASVALSPGASTVVTYDAALHPAGDGSYRGGFETIGFDALAKNVITIGSVTDAVTNGVRDASKANISSFSSWGPTDDGRIKPDLVANGDGVYSTLNGSNTAYGTMSGTSMATPNATGTAALLVQEYARLFAGGAMRSATLKALLIHTADDRGQPGPDYKFGWGLLNGQAAADLLRDHAVNPLKIRLTEGLITSGSTTITHEFVWDGVTPIHATLAWTDPAGTATTTSDLRTPRLRNNLDLKIVSPAGAEFLPYVMPFVGTWTQASMDLPATTGKNNTDNVEQVRVAVPPAPGVYRAVITFDGTLANNQQHYSLLVTGSSNEEPPPPPLSVASITPANALPGPVTLDITGAGFKSGATVRLVRSGQSDRVASSASLVGEILRAQLDLTGAAAGLWDVRVSNTDGETATLAAAFNVIGALWSETFDGTVSGWTSTAETGSNSWTLSTVQSHTPTRSYFASGPATKTTASLVSPTFTVPSGATNLQLKFWHRYDLQSGRDGGQLEFSVNGGTWFNITASGSGTTFASNGYNMTLSGTGNPNNRSAFDGQAAWSGNSNGFVETIVNLTDTTKFAGNTLRARWRLATDSSTASAGWYVDTISLVGGGNLSNAAPLISTAANTASTETITVDETVYQIVRGGLIGVSVSATDDGGVSNLTYTWTANSSAGTPVGFEPNGTNAARLSTAYFEGTGDYVLTVTVRDAQGLATSSSVNVRVLPTADAINVSPAVASVVYGGTQGFAATVLDQFGQPMASQPTAFTWTASGGGAVSSAGLFTATAAGGPYTLSATSGGLSGIASVTVNQAAATVTFGGLEQLYSGAPRPVSVTTTPAGLAVSVTYDGTATAPTAPGNYAVVAAITDPNHQGGASATLVIEKGVDTWAESAGLSGADADPLADPDGDGVPNLLAYALGFDPHSPEGNALPQAETTDGRLTFTFNRIADPGLIYAVEVSSDLMTWTVLDVPGNPSTGEENVAGPVTITDTHQTSAAARRFLRLRVGY